MKKIGLKSKSTLLSIFILIVATLGYSEAVTTQSPYQAGSPWPTMRGDMKNTGRASNLKWEAAAGEAKVARFKTGNGIFSTPVIDAMGRIYVGSADHFFYAFDPREGKTLWKFDAGEIIDSAACIGKDGAIYVPAGDARLHALSPDGKELWNFDVLTKRARNQYSLSTNYWFEANVVMGPDGNIYVANDDFFFYKLATDGKLLWNFRTGLLIWSAAAFDNGMAYIAGFDMSLYALHMETGRVKWSKSLDNSLVASPAIGEDGVIYQGTFGGKLYALDGRNGHVKWSMQTGGHVYSSAAIGSDGVVYVASTDGSLYAIDPAGGKVKWTYYAGDAIRSSPAVGPDPEAKSPYLVYFGGGDGRVYAIDPNGAKRWSYNTLADAPDTDYPNINASPALGVDGLAIATAGGDVLWIPYNYYLQENARGIERESANIAREGASWHYVTPGGLFESAPLGGEYNRAIQPSQVITIRLLTRDKSESLPARLDLKSIAIETTPSFKFTVEAQSDGATISIIPARILAPNTDYKIKIATSYFDAAGKNAAFDDTLSFRTDGPGESGLSANGNAAFDIHHMAIPLPAIVPSLDQIGIASLDIPFVMIPTGANPDTFVAWGVQRFGETESGEQVGIPAKRNVLYAFSGVMRDGYFLMESYNCFYEITAFPIPLDYLRIAGKLTPGGTVAKGASLYAEYRMSGMPEMPNMSTETAPEPEKKSEAKSDEAGFGQFMGAAKKTLGFMMKMLCHHGWRAWGLFNHENKFVGVGTFRMSPLGRKAAASREQVTVSKFQYDPDKNRVIAEIEAKSTAGARRSVFGILLVDTTTGRALPVNYNLAIERETLASGSRLISLGIPKSFRLNPGKTRAYLMSDLEVVRQLEF